MRPESAGFNIAAITVFAAMLGGNSAFAAAELAGWKHGIVEAKGDSAFLFMPVHGGFTQKRGLDVEMVQFASGSTATRALVAGALDSFESSPVVAISAMHQGAPIKVIGCHWPVMTYSLYARPEIDSIEDLRGKNIGVSTPGSLPDLFAREALASAGLSADEFTFGNAGSSSNRFLAVAAGVVAAAASSSEFEIEAQPRGIKVLVRAAEATPNFLRSCIFAMTGIIETRRDDLVRYLAAAMEGYQYTLDHRDEAVSLAREVADLDAGSSIPEFIYDEAIRTSAVTPDLEIPPQMWQWTNDMMVRHGAATGARDASEFVDDSLRQEALRLRGQE
jgi:NitT/TauT family transport system substrate-binding protein